MTTKIFNQCDKDITLVAENATFCSTNLSQSVSENRETSPAHLTLLPGSPSIQCLTIEVVPPNQRVTPDQVRYVLILKPSNAKIPGQFFAHETDRIISSAKRWIWMVDEHGRLKNFDQLEFLIDQVLGGQQ